VSRLRVGIDLRGSTVLVVRVDSDATPTTIMALGMFADGQRVPEAVLCDAVVAIGIPDPQTQTKIVHLPAIGAEHQMAAACFETTVGLLDPDSSLAVSVMPIGQASSENNPTQWLGMAVRKTRLQSVAEKWLGMTPTDPTPDFLARGVALGRGYLRFCETRLDGTTVICDLGSEHTSICFLSDGSILGTATLRPLPNPATDGAGIREWTSELETLIRYRMGIGATAPAQPALVFAGERADETDNLQGQFTQPCSVARLRPEYRQPEAGEAGLSTDWLVALGLTVN
jgi:hypothetical protein